MVMSNIKRKFTRKLKQSSTDTKFQGFKMRTYLQTLITTNLDIKSANEITIRDVICIQLMMKQTLQLHLKRTHDTSRKAYTKLQIQKASRAKKNKHKRQKKKKKQTKLEKRESLKKIYEQNLTKFKSIVAASPIPLSL